MSDFIFSPSENLFFKKSLQDRYEQSGLWPDDGFDVDDSIFIEFAGLPPSEKVRVVGEDGYPAWGDKPLPTQDEISASNEVLKSALRAVADDEMAWRQDAVDAGIATEEEAAALAEWKKYRVLLMRVDTADPSWPTPPGQQAS